MTEEQKYPIPLETMQAVDVYGSGKVDEILETIEAKVMDLVVDTSTPEGEKECKATARKIARSKVYLDDLGKDLVSDWKKKAKVVDVERKKIRDKLDSLKAFVLRPIEERKQKAIAEGVAKAEAKAKAEAEEWDRIEAENAKLREEAEKAQKALIEQEAQARRERSLQEAVEAAAVESRRIAELEADRQVREAKAEAERASRALREKAIAEGIAKEEANRKAEREADRQHRASVHTEILREIVQLGVDEALARKIVAAIAKREIALLRIIY